MTYVRPGDRAGALRLHMNENTGGCSQAVIDAIRQISAEDVAYYPDYTALVRECAAYLGVTEPQLVLTNGLDEGLWALTVSAFRTNARRRRVARSDRAGAGVRDVLGVYESGRRAHGRCRSETRFRVPDKGDLRRHHGSHADHLSDESEQSDGPADSARRASAKSSDAHRRTSRS